MLKEIGQRLHFLRSIVARLVDPISRPLFHLFVRVAVVTGLGFCFRLLNNSAGLSFHFLGSKYTVQGLSCLGVEIGLGLPSMY